MTLPVWIATTDAMITAMEQIVSATRAGDAAAASAAAEAFAALTDDAATADRALRIAIGEGGSSLTAAPLERLAAALGGIEGVRATSRGDCRGSRSMSDEPRGEPGHAGSDGRPDARRAVPDRGHHRAWRDGARLSGPGRPAGAGRRRSRSSRRRSPTIRHSPSASWPRPGRRRRSHTRASFTCTTRAATARRTSSSWSSSTVTARCATRSTREGRCERDEVLAIGRELLAGLGVVHERGLVHCDVKSGNVMLGAGPAKLIDFGIARSPDQAPEGDTSIGSLQFMSPEQLHGDVLTPASDLFSLGVVLYEALTGRLPYPGSTPEEVSAAHRAGTRPAALHARRRRPRSPRRGDPAGAAPRSFGALPQRRGHGPCARRRRRGGRSRPATTTRRRSSVRAAPVPAARRRRRGTCRRPCPHGSRLARRRSDRGRSHRPARRARGVWGVLGTLLILGAAALVVAPRGRAPARPGWLERRQRRGIAVRDGSGIGRRQGPVTVPETVGLATADAIERATEADLDWTVHCNDDPAQPEGIIDQEPPAGTPVAPGSTFTMFSARISDCR